MAAFEASGVEPVATVVIIASDHQFISKVNPLLIELAPTDSVAAV